MFYGRRSGCWQPCNPVVKDHGAVPGDALTEADNTVGDATVFDSIGGRFTVFGRPEGDGLYLRWRITDGITGQNRYRRQIWRQSVNSSDLCNQGHGDHQGRTWQCQLAQSGKSKENLVA